MTNKKYAQMAFFISSVGSFLLLDGKASRELDVPSPETGNACNNL